MSGGPSEKPFDPADAAAFHRARINQLLAVLTPLHLASILNSQLGGALADSFARAHADEGTVWILDEQAGGLVPVWNSGAQAGRFVLSFVQPLSSGIVSMVFATEQPFLENQVHRNRQQDPRLDRQLGVKTMALIVVPLFLSHHCCGVISCVQLIAAGTDNWTDRRFDVADLACIQTASSELSRRLEERLTESGPAERS